MLLPAGQAVVGGGADLPTPQGVDDGVDHGVDKAEQGAETTRVCRALNCGPGRRRVEVEDGHLCPGGRRGGLTLAQRAPLLAGLTRPRPRKS